MYPLSVCYVAEPGQQIFDAAEKVVKLLEAIRQDSIYIVFNNYAIQVFSTYDPDDVCREYRRLLGE